jgi:predicted AlkP superfamily pyrophosphatase or phosphodiesterase
VADPVAPDYEGGALSGLFPQLLGHPAPAAASYPIELDSPAPTVLLLLDGLGWEQLVERRPLMPNLSAFEGGPITTVAPSTTATALTSLTTGLTPGEHGIVGYRMMVDGDVLNTLRWGSASQPDARRTSPPEMVQPFAPFLGETVPLVSKAEFRTSGFSKAHLRGGRLVGYRTLSTMMHEVVRLVSEGERLVYAYYDGIDKVSHEFGLRSEFDFEVAFTDSLVGQLIEKLPSGTRLIVTADHGQVDCGGGLLPVHPDVMASVDQLSGEGRFRWLHTSGRVDDLLAAALEHHGHHAWVRSIEQICDERWFGRTVRPEVRDRLGDVALLPFEPIAFDDPADSGPFELIGRHGSLTSAEMYVPLLSAMS